MKNIRKISLIIMLFTLYKADGLLGSSAGADTVQTIEQRGLTGDEEALFKAVRKGDEGEVARLIGKGVNVNLIEDVCPYKSLLSISVQMLGYIGSEKIVTMLLVAGADPNYQAEYRYVERPLVEACWHCNKMAVRKLLDAGANVNARNRLIGETALMVACRYWVPDIVNMLLDVGADLKVQTFHGETVFEYCKNSYRSGLTYLLFLKTLLLRGNTAFTKEYTNDIHEILQRPAVCDPKNNDMCFQDAFSVKKSACQIFRVFDALNKEDRYISPEQQESIGEIQNGYECFLNGDHEILRDILLRRYVAYDALSKQWGRKFFTTFNNGLINIIKTVFKPKSIEPLLYFLSRTKQERVVADAILADISEGIESKQKAIEATLADIKQPIEVERRGQKRER